MAILWIESTCTTAFTLLSEPRLLTSLKERRFQSLLLLHGSARSSLSFCSILTRLFMLYSNCLLNAVYFLLKGCWHEDIIKSLNAVHNVAFLLES